jgi:chromosome segregation ATPase
MSSSKKDLVNKNNLLELRLKNIPKHIEDEKILISELDAKITEKEKDVEILDYQIKNIDLLIAELQEQYSDIAEELPQFSESIIAPLKVQE